MPVKRSTKRKADPEQISHLRALAHDLSNSLEAIMQASYLLGQAKLDPRPLHFGELSVRMFATPAPHSSMTHNELKHELDHVGTAAPRLSARQSRVS
jgi:hypothetical protein